MRSNEWMVLLAFDRSTVTIVSTTGHADFDELEEIAEQRGRAGSRSDVFY